MNTLVVVVLAALYTHNVYCSYYHGPTAKPVVLHNGYLADTHEVAAAKNAHLATLSQQSHYGGHYGYGGDSHAQYQSGSHGSHEDIRYHGPTAIPHILHDGHIADTHEVAAARAEHFAAVAKAAAHVGYGDDYSGRYASAHGTDHGYPHHVAPYHGPLAHPVVLKTGYLADTHEVAAAKEHHLESLNGARYHGHYSHHYYIYEYYGGHHGYGGNFGDAKYQSSSYGSHGDIKYHGPTAIPHVLHDGHIADTHEVAAAKAEHFAAVAKAAAHGGYSEDYSGRYASAHGDDHGYSNHVVPYHGPLAHPVVLKTGYLADTHEVAAAREHHLEALNGASSHVHYNHHY